MTDPTPSATAPEGPDASRRRSLQFGVATAAAVAGAGLAWWKFQPHAVPDTALDALWALSFQTPTGAPLVMASLRGKPLLINFWATWCPPCIEELPLLDRFFAQQQRNGWQVVGLAIDQPSAVRAYLQRLPLGFPIGMAGLEGTELGRALGNTTGGLPFTVVASADGRIVERKMGKLDEADLARLIR